MTDKENVMRCETRTKLKLTEEQKPADDSNTSLAVAN